MAGKRELLVDAAASVLAQEGAAAVSVRRVAAEVGTSTMAVYTWFGGKDELLAAVRAEGFARFGRRLSAVRRTDDSLRDLHGLGLAYRRFARAEPHLYEAMFGRALVEVAASPEQVEAALATFAILRDAVARAIDAGLLAGEPEAVARQIWAAVHGFVLLELSAVLPDPHAARAYEALLATLMRGLGAVPPQ